MGQIQRRRWARALGAIALSLGTAGTTGCTGDPAPSFVWQGMQRDLPGAMLSVWGRSATDVWSVGADARDGSGPMAIHYDGTRWTRLDTGLRAGALWWVYGTTPDTVWMVGEGGVVLRHNPQSGHTEKLATPGTATLFGVWGASNQDVWAVGGDTAMNTGVLWHFDGTSWSNVSLPGDLGSRVILYKVWGDSARNVWACGSNGTTLHFDGTTWAEVAIPESARGPLFTVAGHGSDLYAVGGNASGIILENHGNGWTQATVDDAPRLSGVFAPATGSPLAVGNSGALWQRRDGRWQQVARPPRTDLDFHSVWVDPSGAVWAVGGDIQSSALTKGVVYRFGERVTTSAVQTPASLTECPNEIGTICTLIGTGEAGWNGDGHDARQTLLYWPMDVTFSPSGQLYFLDWNNHMVRRVRADGTIETVVGTPEPGDGPPDFSDLMEPGAPGTTVSLNHPTDLHFMPNGRLLIVAWHNHKLREWDPATGLTTVTVGRGSGYVDGPLAMARLKQESKAVLSPARDFLYVLDQGNGRVRRIDLAAQTISTIAGIGGRGFAGDGGPALMAQFNWQGGENPEPEGGLTIDPTGRYLFISDTGNQRIRRIDLTAGTISTIAGTGEYGFGGDGGLATMARLNAPEDLELGPDGRLWVADTNNHRIRAIDLTTGLITTEVGTGTRGFAGDRGPANMAELYRPYGIAFDATGNLYVSDSLNNRVRRVQREARR